MRASTERDGGKWTLAGRRPSGKGSSMHKQHHASSSGASGAAGSSASGQASAAAAVSSAPSSPAASEEAEQRALNTEGTGLVRRERKRRRQRRGGSGGGGGVGGANTPRSPVTTAAGGDASSAAAPSALAGQRSSSGSRAQAASGGSGAGSQRSASINIMSTAGGIGGCETTDDEDKRRRKRKPTEEAIRGSTSTANGGGSGSSQQQQVHPSTVYVDAHVRWLRDDGHCTVKTLKELLTLGTEHIPTEADTPLVGPAPSPAIGGQQQPAHPPKAAGSTAPDATAWSPMLSFTLDGIATPNTFATLRGGPSHHPSHGQPHGMAALPPLPPALCVESLYVQIQRNFQPPAAVACTASCSSSDAPPPPAAAASTASLVVDREEYGYFAYYDSPDTIDYFYATFMELADRAAQCLMQEPMMQCVSAPVYVFGDIHGNFADLSYFLKNIVSFNDIQLSPCNILCLGDYVDRGPFSLECVMLLFALKLDAPHKLTLLRGNHEDRVVCGDRKTYGNDCFLAQCMRIFGVNRGNTLFKAVTSAFRYLPLACEIIVPSAPNSNVAGQGAAAHPSAMAPLHSNLSDESSPGGGEVLSSLPSLWHPNAIGNNSWRRQTDQRRQTHTERILCSHGGIPRFTGPPKEKDMLAFLRGPKFPKLLTLFPNNPAVMHDPEVAASTAGLTEEEALKAWYVVFDLMWSDPTTDDTPPSAINQWGFATNSRGSNVVTFSQKAVETFLSAYKYSMLIRAHQEKAHGIRLSKSQKVLTVFSSSNYLGHGNGAGCVVVTQFGDVHLLVKSSS